MDKQTPNRHSQGYVALTAALIMIMIALAGSLAAFGFGQSGGAVTNADRSERVAYVAAGAHPMVNTTPVSSSADCGHDGQLHLLQIVSTPGALGGSNPTLSIQWQNSVDRGVTWQNVGSAVTANATATVPAYTAIKVSDLAASTAQVFGDCWRVTYVYAGSAATTTASFRADGIEK